jgi:hypothetical protein
MFEEQGQYPGNRGLAPGRRGRVWETLRAKQGFPSDNTTEGNHMKASTSTPAKPKQPPKLTRAALETLIRKQGLSDITADALRQACSMPRLVKS